MEIRVELEFGCERLSELTSDEIYVTVGTAEGGGASRARCFWGGRLVPGDLEKCSTAPFEVWRGDLSPGETVAVVVNLVEQDGLDYKPGIQLAEQMALRAGGCIAGPEGSDAVSSLMNLDFEPVTHRACSAVGCLKGDDLLGAFMVILASSPDGEMTGRLRPISHANCTQRRCLILDGDGSLYTADVFINGRSILSEKVSQAG
jgi:hypothetical protein